MSKKNNHKSIKSTVMVGASCIALAGVWGILVTPGTARALHNKHHNPGGGPVGQNIGVCITFHAASFIQADSDDPYCDGNLKDKVTAIVSRVYNILLDGNKSKKKKAGRTFFLDLSDRLGCELSVKVDVSDGAGGGSNEVCDTCFPDVPDLPDMRFGMLPSGRKFGYPDNAALVIYGRDLDDLKSGYTFDTNARLGFSVGGETYFLHWGPYQAPSGVTYCPQSDPVQVKRGTTYVENDTWTFESTDAHLACLYRETSTGPEYLGQFFVPFGATAVAMPEEFVGLPEGGTTLLAGAGQAAACVD